jgi:diacylglycerol kinase family enzyme
VFFNPAAGGGSRGNFASTLRSLFAEAGLDADLVTIDSPDRTRRAVRSAIDAGARAIVAAGGDGTVSSVASELVGGTTPLGVLPFGTLNHFARDAGLPIDPQDAVRAIAGRHVRRVDAGEVNGRAFLNNSSIGVYPDIVVEREALRAKGYRKWTAFAAAAARILSRYRGVVCRVTTPGGAQVFRTPFLFIGNNEYQVEGLQVGQRTRLDGGQLHVYLAPRLHGRDLPKLAALALAGRVRENPSFESFPTGSLDVETPGRSRIRVALDGEVTVLQTPLHYRIQAAALPVIVPGG